MTTQTLLEQFLKRAERLDVAVFPHGPTPALKEWLDKIRTATGFQEAWVDPAMENSPPFLEEALSESGFQSAFPLEPREIDSSPNVALGVTRADFGLAYSGSLAFIKANPLVTLVPAGLLVVLDAKKILPAYKELFLELTSPLPAILSLVTGPSQTSDIEKKLIKGVHGPKWVAILLHD